MAKSELRIVIRSKLLPISHHTGGALIDIQLAHKSRLAILRILNFPMKMEQVLKKLKFHGLLVQKRHILNYQT